MSNHVMTVPLFNVPVRCETNGYVVCLNDLAIAGNAYRSKLGRSHVQISSFVHAAGTKEYVLAAAKEWGVTPESMLYNTGKGVKGRTMAHVSIAMLMAEMISPEFHAKVHRVFIEGELLKFRALGGTEFVDLNHAIDAYLPGRVNEDGTAKDNHGVRLQISMCIRASILGADATSGDWNKATSVQTHQRYAVVNTLVTLLKLGGVRDYAHLKEATVGAMRLHGVVVSAPVEN